MNSGRGNSLGNGASVGNGASNLNGPFSTIDPLTGVRLDPNNRLLMCVSI